MLPTLRSAGLACQCWILQHLAQNPVTNLFKGLSYVRPATSLRGNIRSSFGLDITGLRISKSYRSENAVEFVEMAEDYYYIL